MIKLSGNWQCFDDPNESVHFSMLNGKTEPADEYLISIQYKTPPQGVKSIVGELFSASRSGLTVHNMEGHLKGSLLIFSADGMSFTVNDRLYQRIE